MSWSGKYFDELLPQISNALSDYPMEKLAQEEKETKEDLKEAAIEHAKTYWMLGWTWDEIGALLEDMEFPESSIKAALKEAQLYAVETLKDGPYGRYKYGQLVKLRTGKFAKVVGQTPEELLLADLETGETYSAPSEMIYAKRSAKLTEAFVLRKTAAALRNTADEKDLIDPGKAPGVEEYEDFTPNKITEKQDFVMTPSLRRPKEEKWPHDYPEDFYDVEEASEEVGTWMSLLESLHSDTQAIEKQIKEIKSRHKEELKPLEKEKNVSRGDLKETQEALIGILSAEENVLDQLDEPVFKRFGDLLIGLHKTITTAPMVPGPIDEFNLLMDSINTVLPKTKVEKVLEYFDRLKKLHTLTEEIIETKGVFYKAPEQIKKGMKTTAGVWDKIKNWFKHALGVVTKQSNEIIDDIIPAFEEASDLIEDYLSGLQTKTANKKMARLENIFRK